MAELSPEFIATAKRMGVPLPPRRRPRFFSSVRSYFRFRIDWTRPLTARWRPEIKVAISVDTSQLREALSQAQAEIQRLTRRLDRDAGSELWIPPLEP